MKYPHILDKQENHDDKKLVFTHIIDRHQGAAIRNDCQPSDWEHTRHLTGNLYYCWNNEFENQGMVYLGQYQ